MSIASAIKRGLVRLESQLAVGGATQTFIWKGAEIPCTPNSKTSAIFIDEDEVNILDVKQEIFVRMTHFITADSTLITVDSELYTVDNDTPVPVVGKTVEFPRGTDFRIAATKIDASKAYVKLSLVDSIGA